MNPLTDTPCPHQSPMQVPPSKRLDTDKKEGVLATPPYLPQTRPDGREVMIRQPFKR